jgi:5,10-methylenetetrahydrofolate reductase
MADDAKRKETGALLIAASIIAAICLRGDPIKPSPKLSATIADSVDLATLVLRQIHSRYD